LSDWFFPKEKWVTRYLHLKLWKRF
jgi:hypothetical protein